MLAYSGTYKFDGKTIEHHIDLSWNQIWSGTTQVRDIKKDGDRLIYTTRPAPKSGAMDAATFLKGRERHSEDAAPALLNRLSPLCFGRA
jgi:hypothetical protein